MRDLQAMTNRLVVGGVAAHHQPDADRRAGSGAL